MLLEKLKQHGGKIMFFVMNILVVATGVMFIRQKNVEQINSSAAEIDAQNYKAATDYALDAQQRIKADKELKTNSVAGNSNTVQKDQVVQVTRTIPAVTKTVTTTQPTTAKTTTKKS